MLKSRGNALVVLHITIFIWGWTGILGRLIEQSTFPLVYTRTVIALIGIAVLGVAMRQPLGWRSPDLKHWLLTGLIIAAHWITFYGAIKISTASIAAGCLASSTMFTALLEPIWFKRRIRVYEVVLGAVVIAALLMIFGLETEHRWGIVVATISSFLSAWFNVVNGVLVKRDSAFRIGFYEMLSVVVVMGIACAVLGQLPPPIWTLDSAQISYHLLLGIVCTTISFTAGIAVMKQLSPFTVMLAVNLEPVYTIIIALLIWPTSEKLHMGSYFGFALIIGSLLLNAWWQRRQDPRTIVEPEPLVQG
ncbi:MAG: DMT family transporter [Flavobacteriales bacterium]